MSMIDESELQRMHRLVRRGLPRDLEDVQRRARQIRRQRRNRRVGGGLLTLAVLAGGVAFGGEVVPSLKPVPAVLPPQPLPGEGPEILPGRPIPEPARMVSPEPQSRTHNLNCNKAYVKKVDPADLGTLPRLPARPPQGSELLGAWARLTTEADCLTTPLLQGAAIDLAEDGATVERALAVWGPDAGTLDAFDSPAVARKIEPVNVRGGQGQLSYSTSVEQGTLGWAEDDGERWLVSASGYTEPELRQAVTDLQITDRRLVSDSLPASDAVAGATPGKLPVAAWMLPYGESTFQESDIWIELRDARGTVPILAKASLAAAGTVQFVDVYGNRALLTRDSGRPELEWDTKEGYKGRAQSSGSVEELVAVARSLERVEPDDPRLEGMDEG